MAKLHIHRSGCSKGQDSQRNVYTDIPDTSDGHFNHDIRTLLLSSENAKQAAKVMQKQQEKISRKKIKRKSKELPKCIEKYNSSLIDLQSAVTEMDNIVSVKDAQANAFHQQGAHRRPIRGTSSLKEPKTKKSKTVDYIQPDCNLCPGKDMRIVKLERDLESLKQVLESNEQLERNYRAEKQEKDDALRSLKQVLESNEQLERNYRAEKQEKDDALRRLSELMSSRLRDNNPNITDLSDQNRPTKIAEKMSELYDNQWTNAFDALESCMEEREIVETLLNSLMNVYRECQRLASENFFERIQGSIELPAEVKASYTRAVVMPDQLKQQIKEFRKSQAAKVLKEVEKVVLPRIEIPNRQFGAVERYLSQCVEIGWLSVVQDPPLVLSATSSTKFDTNMFRDYTRRGPYVEFMVWPALLLHEGGSLLSKGIAQGCDLKISASGNPSKIRATN